MTQRLACAVLEAQLTHPVAAAAAALLCAALAALILLCGPVQALEPVATAGPDADIELVDGRVQQSLLPWMDMLDEGGQSLTPDQVLRAANWHPAHVVNSALRGGSGHFWLRGWLHNPGAGEPKVYLGVGHARAERIEMFLYDAAGRLRDHQAAGTAVPVSARVLAGLSPMFVLQVPAGVRQRVLVHVQNDSAVDVDAMLWNPATYQRAELTLFGVHLLVTGVALGLVGLLLVIRTGPRAGWLIGWVISHQAYMWAVQGTLMLVWPGMAGPPVTLLKLGGVFGMLTCFLQLARAPFRLHDHRFTRWIDRLIHAGFLGGLLAIPLFGLATGSWLVIRVALCALLVLPLAGGYASRAGLLQAPGTTTEVRSLVLVWVISVVQLMLQVFTHAHLPVDGGLALQPLCALSVYLALFLGQWRAYRVAQQQGLAAQQAVLQGELQLARAGMEVRTRELNRALETSAAALLRVTASEQRLDAILSTAFDGVLNLRVDGSVELANAAAARLLNVPMDELLESNLFSHLTSAGGASALLALQAGMHAHPPSALVIDQDFAPLRSGAGPRWLRVAINPSTGLHAGTFVCILTDVTASRNLQDRLVAKRQRMTAAVENNQVTTWELHVPSGQFDPSVELARSLGYSLQELQRCTIEWIRDRLYHPDDRIAIHADFLPLYRGEVTNVISTLRVRRRDGTYIWVRASGTSVVQDADGRPVVVFGTLVDISELVQARESAERTLRSKDAFVATMTHELRTPLNSILGFGQMLEADPALNTDQRENVDYILQATRHLIYLVNQTLDLARLESGHMQAQCEEVDLATASAQGEQMILLAAAARQITVYNRCTPACVALADRQLVKQILLNLLSNAVKYNRLQGSITLDCGARADGHVWVSVRDTGRGVRAEDMEALFEPFVRLDTDSSTTEGSGIGLAISRDLARLMNGQLEVSSQPGEGSTFRLILPGLPAAEVATA